jgi:hypothetical protein
MARAWRLFHGDLIEGIDGHLGGGGVHARAVRVDADPNIGIDHTFDGDQQLHGNTWVDDPPRILAAGARWRRSDR